MMDSASSGSMQSSSGGGRDNDEYESHGGEPMSSFLEKHDLSSSRLQQQPQPNFFDLSVILDTSFQQNANLRHYLTSNQLNSGNLSSSSSSLASFSQSIPVGSQLNSGNNNNINQASSSKGPDEQKNIIGIKSSSKKRSRASRRAPTTVLTTDTTNFRQMVQEFTGIPAPPFIGSRGFDLFSRSHQMSAFLSSNPLRPSSQKESSSTSPSLLNSRLINARGDFEVVTTENGLPPNLKQPHQNQTENVFNNMQNQYTFQPLQQSTLPPLFKGQGSSSMAANQADLDELAVMHNHQG